MEDYSKTEVEQATKRHKKAQRGDILCLLCLSTLRNLLFLLLALREFADQGEQRQVHRDDDRADGDAEEADQ